MSGTTIAAPSGADVSSASSSATTTSTSTPPSTTTKPSTTIKPQSAGKPSRNSITKSLKEKRAETAKTDPAVADVVDANAQPAGALGADDAGKKPEGETAKPEAGKGDDEKPKGNGDGDLPPWMRERLGKEKSRREKLEANLSASKTNEAKLRHVVDVAVKENERLTGMLAKAGLLDERGEELQAMRVQQAAKEQFATIDQQGAQALSKSRNDEQISALASQMKAACEAACVEFPLVSYADLKGSLRENPRADVREVARALHEQRMAFKGKQAPTAALQAAPTTVGKPTGTSRNLPALNAKGMAIAVKSARARS